MFRLNTNDIAVYQDHYKRYFSVRVLMLLVYLAAALYYLSWRVTVINPHDAVSGWVLFGAEFYIFLASLLFVMSSWRVRPAISPPAPEGLNVDVFVPTYNESVSIIRRTLYAAVNIEYPHQTWLLDDGNRPEMKALAEELGCRYLARKENTEAKAGNLNNALKHSTADFIAFFDADHIAEKTFLHKLLGYFNDPKVGFVQTPQSFYNTNSFEHRGMFGTKRKLLWEEQSLFYRLQQPAKDHFNGMFFCGCSGVIRREALDAVGGFLVQTSTEDIHTSLRIHRKGYRSIFHNETLAYGIGSSQFDAYCRQRLRWKQGNLHTCKLESVPFTKGLSFWQKICYATVLFTSLEGWARLVFYTAPIVVLLFGFQPIVTTIDVHLMHILPFLLLVLLYVTEAGRGYARVVMAEHYGMAKYALFCIASSGVFGVDTKFKVTPKSYSGKLPIFHLLPQFTLLILNLAAIIVGISGYHLGIYANNALVPVMCILAAFNAAFAWSVIHVALRCQDNDAEFYPFAVPLPMRLKLGKETLLVTSTAISTKECQFTLPQPQHIALQDHISGEIFLPEGPIRISGHVTACEKNNITLRFNWDAQAPQDQLNYTLHNCTWHRILLNQREFIRTPLYLIDALIRKLLGKAEETVAWELFPYQDKKDNTLRMGLRAVTEHTRKALPYCLLFSPSHQEIIAYEGFMEQKTGQKWHLTPSSRQAPSGLYLFEYCA